MLKNRTFLKRLSLFYTISVLLAVLLNMIDINHAVNLTVSLFIAFISVLSLVLFLKGFSEGYCEIDESFDHLPVSVVITDKSGVIEYANRSFETLTGYSNDELLGSKIGKIKSGKTSGNTYRELWETILSGKVWKGKMWNKRKDGSLFYEKIKISPMGENGGNERFIAVIENYTEDYRKLERSRETQQLMKSIMDNIPIGVVVMNNEKEIVQINRTVADILKYKTYMDAVADLKGKECCRVICDNLGICALKKEKTIIKDTKVTININGETVSIIKTVFPVTLNGEPMYLEMLLDISDTIKHETELQRETERANLLAQRSKEAEERLKKYNENLETMVRERTDELHQVIRNLTEAQSQLVQSEKLISIGQLAAGIAHEINTPIQYVGDNLRFFEESFYDLIYIAEKYESVPEMAKNKDIDLETLVSEISEVVETMDLGYLKSEMPGAIEQSLEGVDRVAGIVRSMKEFSHPGTVTKTEVDINKAIQSTIIVSRNEWKYHADVVTEFDETIPSVPCYPGELNQVFLNIIINAAHAIAEKISDKGGNKGVISVKTARGEGFVEIRISDSGCGIPEKIQNKIFDPFFTTKEVGKGTGQGLSISYSVIVEKHGGTLTFETIVGEGTTFIITLPTFY